LSDDEPAPVYRSRVSVSVRAGQQKNAASGFVPDDNFNPESMEREKPNLVLFEIVERRLADGAL
jgi:hypothetical protein